MTRFGSILTSALAMGALSMSAVFCGAHPEQKKKQDRGIAEVSLKTHTPGLQWPVETNITSLVTQSPALSDEPYPCGSGVNGRHLLPEDADDATAYFESLDIVAVGAKTTNYEVREGRGTAVVAVAPGRVVAVRTDQNECERPFGAGNYIILEHPQFHVDGKPVLSAYMHLNSTLTAEQKADCLLNPVPTGSEFTPPKVGTWVTQGQKVGEIGDTGNSTGPHLHFQFASHCVLHPAKDVHCPALPILEVDPQGFQDIAIEVDASCAHTTRGIGGPARQSDKSSGQTQPRTYLPDGTRVRSIASFH